MQRVSGIKKTSMPSSLRSKTRAVEKKKKGEGKEKGKKEERRRKFLPRVKLRNQRDYNNKTRERFFRIFASNVIEILLLN